ncbi:MAG TPA: hypothetical protein V6D22_05145 [Candidatus Obscuribacterales bacterium]
MFDKIVIVTRKTRLQELIERFNTRGQAKFYIEHSGGNFSDYAQEDDSYNRALDGIRRSLNFGLKIQFIDRSFLPTYLFTNTDLIIALGQDGLVANTAKYVGEQPILGVNPDPMRYDGVLVPLQVIDCKHQVDLVLNDKATFAPVTLAQAELNDGQKLLAFNDMFIGVSSHVSARYQLSFDGKSEPQSSSGIIVATGAGSTGWLSSVFNMVGSLNHFFGAAENPRLKLDWDAQSLMFVVREPFVSKHSAASVVTGMIDGNTTLILESRMPSGGIIFSDGVESDFLTFNSGSIATIGVADKQARLVVPGGRNNTLAAARNSSFRLHQTASWL